MPYNIYDTHELREMVEISQPLNQFLLNMFFNPIVESDAEVITFDVMNEPDTLAPFVSPCTAGKPRRKEGFSTQSFKPPYIKIKGHVSPCDTVKRLPGEAIGGSLTQQARLDMAIDKEISAHSRKKMRRMEWMAAKALQDGKFTVTGEDVPEQEIDFGRSASLTYDVTSTGNVVWTDTANAEPLEDLETASGLVLDEVGIGGADVIMNSATYKAFSKVASVKTDLDCRRGVDGEVTLTPQVAAKNLFKGTIGGFRIWVYNDSYLDDAGVRQKMIDDGKVIVVAGGEDGLGGYQAYGAIQDLESLQPTDIFTKMWEEKDPSGMCILSQSAGIVIPSRVNAVAVFDVFA